MSQGTTSIWQLIKERRKVTLPAGTAIPASAIGLPTRGGSVTTTCWPPR